MEGYMNPIIEQSLQQISMTLNSDIHMEDNHAWLIPSTMPEVILTILWTDDEATHLTFSLALGSFDEATHTQLAVNMLAANLGMAVHRGPKLSYSPGSGLLTMLDTLPCHPDEIVGLGDAAESYVKFGYEVREQYLQQGFNLTIPSLEA
jgi:hypothetical protein